MRFPIRALIAASAVLTAAPALAAPTDLTNWTREGTGGTWTQAADHNSVTQSVNGDPTVYYSDFNALGRTLSGTIRVNGTSDDDFIGFVIGFNPGELTGPSDFLLIDWKQTDQSFNGFAPAGLAVSSVSNGLADNNGAWAHNALGVTELQRGATLHDTGWADLTTYTFNITYTATNLQVFVNGGLEIDLNGNFADGRIGFYNYSQANVTYAGIQDDILPPVVVPGGIPEPTSWALMIMGFGGLGAALRRKRGLAIA